MALTVDSQRETWMTNYNVDTSMPKQWICFREGMAPRNGRCEIGDFVEMHNLEQ